MLALDGDIARLRELVVRRAVAAGLDPERVWAVGLAVQVRSGGAGAVIRVVSRRQVGPAQA